MDDLGWHHDKFMRVLELFVKHGHKLNAEAIPLSCLENVKPGSLKNYQNNLEVHCHGFSHLDHQNAGKKAEFGSQRVPESVYGDFVRGQEILKMLFADLYFPIFTPPWNRIDPKLYDYLVKAGFKGLSRDGKQAANNPQLPDLNIGLDLHTQKNQKRYEMGDLISAIDAWPDDKNTLGVMLHHKPMVETDYEFLEAFLKELNNRGIQSHFMSVLL
jgi:hypothetical protein